MIIVTPFLENDPILHIMNKKFNIYRDTVVCLFLVLAILVVFSQVKSYDFVSYDDDVYITKNRHVQGGLTVEGIIWAFTIAHSGNWHPLTWLSHMLDISLFGLNPGYHHLMSLLFHIANTLLLFFILRRMTGEIWKSGFVAALFALHPLHVESVAWIAERKDVLSTFFFMLTILAYVFYVEKPVLRRYLFVFFFFVFGLLSKTMLVTLPFLLLLLDYWPLSRFEFKSKAKNFKVPLHLIWEKVPLFALTALSSIVTFFAEKHGKSVSSLEIFPIKTRIANTFVSYVSYIGKMIWSLNLAVFYPYPEIFPIWQVMGSLLLLVCISFLVIRHARSLPYLPVGWLWYLGTLVPVIGLVQIGSQSMADRYTYVSLIGLFIMIAWGVPDILKRWRYQRIVLSVSLGIILLLLMIFTWYQTINWKNSITLFEHALKVTTRNNIAHNNLGTALAREGKLEEAIYQFREALKGKPDFSDAHYNLGTALGILGNHEEAVYHLREALKGETGLSEVHNKIGRLLSQQKKFNEAIYHFQKALEINPDFANAHNNIGIVLGQQGRLEEAIYHFREALRTKPYYAKAHNNLGVTLGQQGKLEEAIYHFQKALEINPGFKDAENNLRKTLSLKKKF